MSVLALRDGGGDALGENMTCAIPGPQTRIGGQMKPRYGFYTRRVPDTGSQQRRMTQMTTASIKPVPAGKAKFAPGDFVIYPGHGLGKVDRIERQTVAKQEVQVLVINFESDRMTLRVPLQKVPTSGLRPLSTRQVMDKALMTLKG